MKDIKSIVYDSKTGITESYARLLATELNLPVFSIDQAKKHLKNGDNIVFFGWVMNSTIMGLKKVQKLYNVRLVASTGLFVTNEMVTSIKKKNFLPKGAPYYPLKSGLLKDKLKFPYNFMLNLASKQLSKNKNQKTESNDVELYKIFTEGVNYFDPNAIKPIAKWCRA